MTTISVLDLAFITHGSTPAQALHHTLDLAQHAERWGYQPLLAGRAPQHAGHRQCRDLGGDRPCRRRHQDHPRRLGRHHAAQPCAAASSPSSSARWRRCIPGRIDLGLGRAPGTDQATLRALRRSHAGSRPVPAGRAGAAGTVSRRPPGQRSVRRRPAPAPRCRCGFWAPACSARSWPRAWACRSPSPRISRRTLINEALRIYRERFQPSEQLDQPYAMVGRQRVAADTDAEAQRLFTSMQQSSSTSAAASPGRLPPPIDDIESYWAPPEKAQAIADAGLLLRRLARDACKAPAAKLHRRDRRGRADGDGRTSTTMPRGCVPTSCWRRSHRRCERWRAAAWTRMGGPGAATSFGCPTRACSACAPASRSQIANEAPQPQEELALGLATLKYAPLRSSTSRARCQHIHQRHAVDDDGRTVALDHDVVGLLRVVELEIVAEPGAAAPETPMRKRIPGFASCATSAVMRRTAPSLIESGAGRGAAGRDIDGRALISDMARTYPPGSLPQRCKKCPAVVKSTRGQFAPPFAEDGVAFETRNLRLSAGGEPGEACSRNRQRHADGLSARPGPDRPLGCLPAARGQDPGLHPRRWGAVPHPAYPQPGGRADRTHPSAVALRRRGSGRGGGAGARPGP